MYNAINKPIATLSAAIAVALAATSCGTSASDKAAAEALVAQADSATEAQNYTLAVELLDTLRSRYPAEIEAQRAGMALRPKAEQGATMREMERTDSLSAYTAYRIDSLKGTFALVHDPKLGADFDYYVVKELAKSTLMERNGVEGRVEPTGEFKVLTSLVSNPVRHTSISLSSSAGEVSSATIAPDGERNFRISGSEMMTMLGAECDTLGAWLNGAAKGAPVKLTFKGQRTYTIPLAAADRRSLSDGWLLASLMKEQRRLTVRRDFLERRLALSRDQMARTTPDPAANQPEK